VEGSLNNRIPCIGFASLGEVLFALPSGVIAPTDLPSITRAVLGGWVEPGAALAVFGAWFVAGDRQLFSWSTDDPPLHARYRLEWKFRAGQPDEKAPAPMGKTASEILQSIGIIQRGDPVLEQIASIHSAR
jgi:hypothetical protein